MSTTTPAPVAQYHNYIGQFESVAGPNAKERAARLDAISRRITIRRRDGIDEDTSPSNGDRAKTLEKLWGYDSLTVNGLMYRTQDEAAHVRCVLRDAGIPHHYPGTKEARAALALAGGGK